MKDRLIIAGMFALFFWGCGQEDRPTTDNEYKPDTSRIPADSLPAAIQDSIAMPDSTNGKLPAPVNNSGNHLHTSDSTILRTGRHKFTLHWISWDKPGTADIAAGNDGWYTISGSQENNTGDYITIKGKLRVLHEKELLFNGTIKYRVASNNNGNPCTKEGHYIFRSTKGRPYWRLQEMLNCDGSATVDYIDLYFD